MKTTIPAPELSFARRFAPRLKRRSLLPLLLATTLASSLHAQTTTTWNGGGTNNDWGTGANWVGGTAPAPGTNSDLVFAGTTRTNPFNNYGAFDDFRNIEFAAGAGTFSITGSAIDLFGKLENNSTNTQTFALDVGVNTTFIEVNAVSGSLNVNPANIFLNENQMRVWGDNGHTLTFGTNTVISSGTNTGSVAINANTRVIYQSAHTYNGSTFVNAGVLRFAAGSSIDNSALRLGDTTGSKSATIEVAGGTTLGGNNILVRPGSSNNTLTIANTDGSGTATVGRTVQLSNNLTASAAAGGNLQFTNAIFSTGNLTVAGAGTVTLTANNTNYSGTTTIGAGSTLAIGANSAGGFGTGDVTNNGTLIFNRSGGATWTNLISGSGSLVKDGNQMLQLSNANTYSGGTIIVNGSTGTTNVSIRLQANEALGTGSLTVGTAETGTNSARLALNGFNQTVSGLSSGSAGTRIVEANGTDGGTNSTLTVNQSSNTSYSGILRDSSGGTGILALVKTGPGTLTLSGDNAYTGKTTVSGGGISIGADTSGSANLPRPTNFVADSLTLSNGGKLVTTGTFSLAQNRGITLGSGGGAIEVASGQTTTMGQPVLVGTNGLTKLGAGTLAISVSQSTNFSGKVAIGEGAISINADSRLGANPVSFTADALTLSNGGKLVTFTNSITLGGNRGITLGAGGGVLETGSGLTLTLGTSNQISGSGNLTKSGDGTLTISAANNYAGSIAVSAGTLNLATNGSLRFVVGGSGTNNALTGAGTALLNGSFTIDLSSASTSTNATWILVQNTLATTYGTNFFVSGFNGSGGLWTNSTNGVDYIFAQSNGILSVVNTNPVSNYSSWVSYWQGVNPNFTNTAPTANPDGDPFDNNEEFAFDGNPMVGTGALLTAVKSGTNSVFNYVARKNPPGGVTYQVQFITNLSSGTWSNSAVTVSNSLNQTNPVISQTNAYERKEFTVPATNNLFFRVQAAVAP